MFSPIAYVKFWTIFISCLYISSAVFSASNPESTNSSPKYPQIDSCTGCIAKAHERLSKLQRERDEAAAKVKELRHQRKELKEKLKILKKCHHQSNAPSPQNSPHPPHEVNHKKSTGEASAIIPGTSNTSIQNPETLGDIVFKIYEMRKTLSGTENEIFLIKHKNKILIERIKKLGEEPNDQKKEPAAPQPLRNLARPNTSTYISFTERSSKSRLATLFVGSPNHENLRLGRVARHFDYLPHHVQQYHLARHRPPIRQGYVNTNTGAAHAPVPAASASAPPPAQLPETAAAASPPPLTTPFIDPDEISLSEDFSHSNEPSRPTTPQPFDEDEPS